MHGMQAPPSFTVFFLASLVLAIIPGPGVIYVVTRTLRHGRRAGLASIGGLALGNLGNAAGASLGLAAVLAASASAFEVLKFGGAAYLVYLGVRTLRAEPTAARADETRHASALRLLREAGVVALLNPKTALFFAALLPPFIDPARPAFFQSLALGCVFVAIAVCTDTAYVFTAAVFANALRRRAARGHGRYFAAAAMIGLGVYAALASPRGSR